MGNFYFPSDNDDKIEMLHSTWYFGYLAELSFTKNNVEVKLHPYKFSSETITLLKGEDLKIFHAYLDGIRKPIGDNREIQRLFDGWCMISGVQYANHLAVTPDMLQNGAEQVKHVKNLFGCEAHNELMKRFLELCYEGRTDEAAKIAEEILPLQEIDI